MDECRKAFEEWISDNYPTSYLKRERFTQDAYGNDAIHTAWTAWEVCWKKRNEEQ